MLEFGNFHPDKEPVETLIELYPVILVKSSLEYANQRLGGAMRHPFLAQPALDRLNEAASILKKLVGERKIELLIWDAYRTPETQGYIFNKYLSEVKQAYPELDSQSARDKAKEFVNPPDIVFPHGTGGAVDLTLLIDNKLAPMGTGFDEFTTRAYADWYKINPPQTQKETESSRNRELLRHVMENAGFVVLDSEWWHFEYGTKTWATKTGKSIILNKILPPPDVQGPSDANRPITVRQPILESGVAQVFIDPQDRSDSLAHRKEGHYYGRSSQPTLENLERQFTFITEAEHVYFTESGLSASLIALKGLVPSNGTIVYDHLVYYEVERGLMYLANQLSWHLIKVDFTELKQATKSLKGIEGVNVFFCDNPRNWWLDTLDLKAISQVAKSKGSKLIVDTSVQPIQPALDYGADLVVMSLSKYPSMGLTLGGAILGNDQKDVSKARLAGLEEGHVLSPEAALTIWEQSITLRDRMFALSYKTEKIAEFLKEHKRVSRVRVPNPKLLHGLMGGQLSFHLLDPQQGLLIEKVVGYNSLSLKSALNLACTFGASFTTLEHFASNERYRIGIPRENTAEALIPSDMIRIGVGSERLEDIIDSLDFVLNITS